MDQEQQKKINPNNLIIWQNIDDADHEWQFDAINTPIPYRILMGQQRELPYYISRLGIDKLIDKILQKKGQNPTNQVLRDQLMDQIVLGMKSINQEREKTPQEMAAEEMRRKKDTDPFEELFARRRIEAERQAARAEAVNQPPAPLYNIEGQRVAPAPAPVNPTYAPVIPAVNPAPVNPPLQQTPAAPVDPIVTGQRIAPAAPINPMAQPTPPVANVTPAPITPAAAISPAEVGNPNLDPQRVHVYNFLTVRAMLDVNHPQTKAKLDSMTVQQIVDEFKGEYPDLADPSRQLVPDTTESLQAEGMPLAPSTPLRDRANFVPGAPVNVTAGQAVPPKPTISMDPGAAPAPRLAGQIGK